jgi:hypothetical protein
LAGRTFGSLPDSIRLSGICRHDPGCSRCLRCCGAFGPPYGSCTGQQRRSSTPSHRITSASRHITTKHKLQHNMSRSAPAPQRRTQVVPRPPELTSMVSVSDDLDFHSACLSQCHRGWAAVRCPALLQPSVSSWWTLQAHGCSAPSCPPLGTSSSPCSYVVYGVLAIFWLPRSVSSKSAKLQLALSSVAVLHRVLTLLSYCAIPRPSVEGIDLVTRPNLELDPHMSPPPGRAHSFH